MRGGSGLLAQIFQHETDHLNGILFIDRMARKTKDEIREQLEELQAATKAEMLMWAEERQKSPIRITPNLRPYTI